jgi:hypothetical protein
MFRIKEHLLKKDKLLLLFLLVSLVCILLFLSFGLRLFPDLLAHHTPWRSLSLQSSLPFSHLKSDFVDNGFPKFELFREAFFHKDLMLWNGYSNMGQPTLSLLARLLFFPLNWLLLILPLDIGFTLMIFLKTLIGFVGMYLWLKELSVKRSISFIMSLVFCMSAFNVVWLFNDAATVSLLSPLTFFGFEKLLKTSNHKVYRLRWVIFLALIIGMLIMTSFVSAAGYTMYFSFAYFIIRYLIRILSKRGPKIKEILSTVLNLSVIAILGVSIAAVVLGPMILKLDFINIEYRSNNAQSFLPIKTLLLLIFPNYYGNPVFNNWITVSNWNEASSFMGILTLVMFGIGTILSLVKKNKRMIILSLFSIATASIIWNIGPLLGLINRLPIFNSSSNTRLIFLFNFFTITVAAWTLNNILKKKLVKYLMFLLRLAGILLIMVATLLLFRNIRSGNLLDEFNLFRFSFMFFELVVLIFGILASILYLRSSISIKEWFFSITTLFLLDMCVFCFGHVPVVTNEFFYPQTTTTQYLQENTTEIDRIQVFDWTFMISGTQLYYEIPTVYTHAFHTVREKEIASYLVEDAWATATAPVFYTEKTDFTSPIWDLLGLKYAVLGYNSTIEDETWEISFESKEEGIKIFRNLEYLDSPYWVTIKNMKLTEDKDFYKNIDLIANREISLYESANKIPTTSENVKNEYSIKEIFRTSDELKLEVCSEYPGLLTMRDSYWPGWDILVNGEEREQILTNYIFRGIEIDSGCQIVEQSYNPDYFKYFIIISLTSIASSLISLIVLKKREKE